MVAAWDLQPWHVVSKLFRGGSTISFVFAKRRLFPTACCDTPNGRNEGPPQTVLQGAADARSAVLTSLLDFENMVMCRLPEAIMYRLLFAHPPASTSQNERTSGRFDSIVVERVQCFGVGRRWRLGAAHNAALHLVRVKAEVNPADQMRKCEEVATATL